MGKGSCAFLRGRARCKRLCLSACGARATWAGFSNLMFSEKGTKVVEIGWQGDGGAGRRLDGKQGMWLSDIYFSLSQALDLDYWLVLAYKGDQVTPLFVDVGHVLATLADL